MHYEVPSLSSMLYEFTNKEQDNVMQAFRVGNWFNLRDLPHNLQPNNVLQQLQLNINFSMHESTIKGLNNKQYLEKLKQNGGYFQRFEWMPEGYDQQKEIRKDERMLHRLRMDKLHTMPFNPS